MKRVPVVNAGLVVGIVSRRDLLRVIARKEDILDTEVAARLEPLGWPSYSRP